MQRFAFVLACAACVVDGRRVQIKSKGQNSHGMDESITAEERQAGSNPFKALALVLLSVNPAAAWQMTGLNFASNPLTSRAESGMSRANRRDVSMRAFEDGSEEMDKQSKIRPWANQQRVAEKLIGQTVLAGVAAVVGLTATTDVASAADLTRSELNQLTYLQVKGTGLANRCPKVEAGAAGTGAISTSGLKTFKDFCIEPTSFQVLEEVPGKNGDIITRPVKGKMMTRQTYTLADMTGEVGKQDGNLVLEEKDGIDYAASTIQIPGGERVPFLFTVKNLVAKSETKADQIEPGLTLDGKFKVPSYRTGLFLDPKGRGGTTGYDQAVALPAQQTGADDLLAKENDKTFAVGDGEIKLQVTSVNSQLGEIGGTFEQRQPSDTDMGSKEAKTILLSGKWFAEVE